MKLSLLTKPRMSVYIALLVAAIACMVALSRCPRRGSGPQKSGGDTIDVAIDYAPLSLYMYDDTLGGFNHDLLQLIERREHVQFKLHPAVSLNESLRLLDEGIYDIVAAQVPVTSDFKRRYLFSDSIYLDRQVLVQRKDSLGNCAVNSQLDIAGKTLYIVKGSPVETRIANLSREIGDTIYIRTEAEYGQEQLFLLVAAGEIDYAVISDKIARSLTPDYPQIDTETAVSFNQFQSWVVRKDNTPLLDSLNTWLRRARTTPEYKQLADRYF